MAKIERFEDVRAWQMARELANLIYEVSEKGDFSRDFNLKDQIQDAAASIMHNIAEGFEAGTDTEFIPFLKYARRSASEVQSELYLALDRNYISSEQFKDLYNRATEIKKSINALIAYLRKSGKRTRPPNHPTT